VKEFKKFLSDVLLKIFQIVFAMLVVGMFVKDKFDGIIFYFGLAISLSTLTGAIFLYYNTTKRGA